MIIKILTRMTSKFPVHSHTVMNLARGSTSIANYCSSDAGKVNPSGGNETMENLRVKLVKAMGVEPGFDPLPQDRAHLTQYLPTSQNELPPRAMKDSFMIGIIPLSKDERLQDKYTTFLGHIRLGRLVEDMDIFAVMVAHKHIVNPKLPEGVPFPQTLVTALVDQIDFTDFVPKPTEDVKISGHVSWVGKSSMEVVVWLEQQMQGVWNRVTRALFVIAARDPTNTSSTVVNPIEPADQREIDILSGGNDRKQRRILLEQRHLTKEIPDSEEQQIIHSLYIRTTDRKDVSLRKRVLPHGCVWMSESTLSSIVFSHPEDRNLHNTVFGGFIMRQAMEMSWVLGYMYSKYRPLLKSISDINFQRPIAVNSLIQMHAHVVYTQLNFIQVTTYVEIFNPTTGQADTSNTFNFTYEVPELVKECLPLTYHEAMMYIDGRRHFLKVMKGLKKDSKNFPSKL